MRRWLSRSAVRPGDGVTHLASSTAATVVRPDKSSPAAMAVAGLILALAVFLFVDGRVWGSTQKVTSPARDQTRQTTTTTTTTRSTASDGLLEALLGTGGALLVFGLAYGRITSITLPGGVVVALSADEDKALSDEVEKQTATKTADEKREVLARARVDALGTKQRKAQSSVALDDQELAAIAERAAADR